MLKRIFSIIFTLFLTFSLFLTGLNVNAYEITGFEITGKSAMLGSVDTGEILYGKNINEKVYPAAITNIMSAIVILENEKYDPNGKIAMTEKVLEDILGTGAAVSHLKQGEKITQLDLLHMLLMCSYGDIGYLAADYYCGSKQAFVEEMNKTAAKLGLKNTHYTNPIGLHDSNHYTTAQDVYTLASYAIKNKTFTEVCAKSRYLVPATNKSPKRTLSTTNFLLDTTTNYYYQYAKGLKTGYTDEAGRCVVSLASYNGYSYICVVMGCKNSADKRYEFSETASLYRWAFNNFSFREVANSDEPVCEIPVELSMETDFVPLYFDKPFISVLPNDADDSTLVIKTHLKQESVKAPVKKGDVLGEAEVIFAENVIGRVNLVVGEDVKENKILAAVDFIKGIFSSVYMKALYVIIALAVVGFIALCIKMNYARLKKRRVRYIPYNGKERENRSSKDKTDL